MSPYISPEELTGLLRKTSETTASSPSNLHIGHYKAMSYSTFLMNILSIVISLPFLYGFTHERWNRSTHHMLEKIPNYPLLDKLRIIQLVEADFNIYQKIKIGRAFMNHLEDNSLLPNELYGGRKHRSTSEPIQIQRTIFDITRQQKTPLISITVDAEACYDRMVPNYGAIAMTALGLHPNIGSTLAKVQHNTKHNVYTNNGLSKTHIQQKPSDIWGGIGQGCASAGPMWMAIEIPMIHTFNQLIQNMKLTSPDHKYTYKQCLTGYIDDTNINLIPTQLCTHDTTSKAISTWNEILSTSGGALSTTKCFFYDVLWNNHKNTLTMSNSASSLTIHDKVYDRQITVNQIPNTTGKRYLGIRLSPSGNMTQEYEHRIQEAQHFKNTLKQLT